MSQLFETIKVYQRKAFNLEYHKKRIIYTFNTLFKTAPFFDLIAYINSIPLTDELSRLKITYDLNNIAYSITPYQRREITALYTVETTIEYPFKYEDRSCFDPYLKGTKEPIFTKNGMITDTTFSNLAFYDGQCWWTPNTYLLKGTKRDYYIEKGILKVTEISVSDLKRFKKISLINAMNDLDDFCFDIQKVINAP
ncbi:MAG: aminotransferase class IV [Calditerrivibrio sp.]|nr:aminotransferase class IV [Calditerrivibrio sp.]